MKRRTFIILLGGAAASPLVARAQQPAKMKRVAMIHPAFKPDNMRIGGDPIYALIFEEMKRLGYAEGVNLTVDRYSAEGRFDRFPEIAREVVATRPDVIFALNDPLVLALLSETHTIPIVAWTGDPVVLGIVSNVARPGGNVTGVSITAGSQVGTKRLQLFVEAVGKLSNLRSLTTPAGWEHPLSKAVRGAAETMKIPFRLEPLQSPINEAEYRRAFDAMLRDHVDGVWMDGSSESYTYRHVLGRLAQEYRLPASCNYTDTVER